MDEYRKYPMGDLLWSSYGPLIMIILSVTGIICILTMIITGCSAVIHGKVIDKTYIPSHTVTHYHKVGKVIVPMTHTEPEKWYITVQGHLEEDGVVDESEIDDTQYIVSESVYNKYEIGDEFDAKKEGLVD